MPRTETFGENLYIRVPRSIRAEVEALRTNERQADFLRHLLLKALANERAIGRGGRGAIAGDVGGGSSDGHGPTAVRSLQVMHSDTGVSS